MSRRLMRATTLAFVLTLVGTLIPLSALPARAAAPAAPAAASPASSGGVRGVGILPIFQAQGSNLIRLQAGAFDPLADSLPTPEGTSLVAASSLPAGTAQYWLVQVKGFRYPAVQAAVKDAGALVAGFLADSTYVVRATPAQRDAIAASSAVRWIGYYQPAWRFPAPAAGFKGLLEFGGHRDYVVNVFRQDPEPASVARALRDISGVKVIRDAGYVVQVVATADQVPAIAAIPAVEWVNLKPNYQLLNANARWVTDTAIRDLYSATAPGRLTGAGVTAAVADTAVNYTYDINGRAHIGFRDCNPDGTGCKDAIYEQVTPGSALAQITNIQNNATGHRKMAAFFDIGASGPNPFDESTHGTHTSGSVTGDRPPYDQYTGEDGLAPAANLVMQNIGTSGGGLTIPADLYDLFRQAYRPRDPADVSNAPSGVNGNPSAYTPQSGGGSYRPLEDARTHNNSWGSGIAGVVPPPDAGLPLDQFVWDYEDMVVVFSAGNDGPDAGTTGSPALAKNDITSGASVNGRQPMASIDSMAFFSSHGPTTDGRFGTDVSTPGQIVVSAKGGTVNGYHTAQGTSMSAPVLTGLATLVRQYFMDGYAGAGGDGFAPGTTSAARSHNPSAALVRAALANGAVRMRGYYTGDNGRLRAQDGQWPSGGQGFGRVNLMNSLYFANDPTNNWYADVYRANTTAAANCTGGGSFPVAVAPASRTCTLHVEAGQPLDVTLAWTDAPTLQGQGSPALVNDLDLVVVGPNGTDTWRGNNMNSRATPAVAAAETLNVPVTGGLPDSRNNTERVRILAPVTGTYTVRVDAGPIATGNQGWALAAGGDISPAGPSSTFTPGPQIQVDQGGNPVISNVGVTPISSSTAKVTFATNEPTTAQLTTTPATTTFRDSYNVGNDPPNVGAPPGLFGLNEGQVETSDEYANKLVVGTKHEILVTGLTPGQAYTLNLSAADLAGTPNTDTETASLASPGYVYQADAPDIGQLVEDPAGTNPGETWRLGTQLYASDTGGSNGRLGAFMFRIPNAAIDPNDITGAVVELVSGHNWANTYTSDPQLKVDLLPSSFEATWGTQTYQQVHDAVPDAPVPPTTTHKVGAYQKYAFTFSCSDLQDLKTTLTEAGERRAAFRYDASIANPEGIFGMDFGFNRRSRGPDVRPRLILFTDGQTGYPDGSPCDPLTPAPTITDVGVHESVAAGAVTVSWNTDVPSDSMVLFREQGTTPWTQVATPALTKVHSVQVNGLDDEEEYEFAVRSAACNGAVTTDANGGAGYDFFRPEPPGPVPTTNYFFHGSSDDEANTVALLASGDPADVADVTFSSAAPDGSEGRQVMAGGNQDFVGNFLGAFWYNPTWNTHIDAPVTVRLWVSATSGVAVGTDITFNFWANPDLFNAEGTKVGEATVTLGGLGPTPTLQTFTVDVDTTGVTWADGMLVQGTGAFQDSPELHVVYDTATNNSNFGIPIGTPPPPVIPAVGPYPAPSAGGSGISPVVHFGPATAADLAAGTGFCDVSAPAASADLSLTKTDSPDPVSTGQNVTYTLTVSNAGPDDAANVVLTDTLPPNGTFVSSTPGSPTCAKTGGDPGGTVTCNLGSINEGAQSVVTITVQAPGTAGTMTNNASATSDASDPTPATAQSATTVQGGAPGCTQTGTSGDDILTGGSGDDVLCGLGGNDVLFGKGGNDTLLGDEGNDTLVGGAGTDTLRGETGNDNLQPGADADSVHGGMGADVVDYADAGAAVQVNLATGSVTGGSGTDTLASVENASGSSFNDSLTGSDGPNQLDGRAGNDTIVGGNGADSLIGGNGADSLIGGGGTDSLDGGGGADTAGYRASGTAVTASLAAGTATDGTGASDTLTSIENLEGSNTAGDSLTGSSGPNSLYGFGGADTLKGGDGNDKLYGGARTDNLDGGPGNDLCQDAADNKTSCETS